MIKNLSPHMPKSKRYYEMMTKMPLISSNARILYYDMDSNTFYDEFGYTIYDIYRIVSPAQVMLFKKQEGLRRIFMDMTNSFLVELVYE